MTPRSDILFRKVGTVTLTRTDGSQAQKSLELFLEQSLEKGQDLSAKIYQKDNLIALYTDGNESVQQVLGEIMDCAQV